MTTLTLLRRPSTRPRLVRWLIGGTILAIVTAVLFGLLSPANAIAAPQGKSPETITDTYLFGFSVPEFLRARKEKRHDAELIWASDGCTIPEELSAEQKRRLREFNFTNPCLRHDFGYRNYRNQGRMNEANRKRIDDRFAVDMRGVCDKIPDAARKQRCIDMGVLYYAAVRRFGDRYA